MEVGIIGAIGAPVAALFVASLLLLLRRRTMSGVLQLAGSVCLLVMVLTHLAEALHLLPGMGWGLPNSAGHYLDLFSAISGVVLLLMAYVVRRRLSS
jgi:hypothetical protein